MGTHLVTGIIEKVLVCKKDIESKVLKTQDIEESLRKELNLAYYVCDEEDGVFSWNIKPKMLEGNFVEFLETQFRMYEDTINKSAQLAIDKIKEARTGDKIIELSKEKNLSRFQMITHLYGSLAIKAPNSFSDYIDVNYHMMAFFVDGKIIMECYNDILHYFEQNIRLQEARYPVVGCLKTLITS